MTAAQYPSRKSLWPIAFALVLTAAAGAQAQSAPAAADASLVESMKRLATEDAQVQQARWGTLAAVAGSGWLHRAPAEVGNVWRDIRWLVPGALMRYHRGLCIASRCQGTDYLVQYDEGTKQLVFLEQGAPVLTGRVQQDGSVRISGNSLIGILTAETLRFDAASQTLFSDSHDLRPATGAQLAEATQGMAGTAAPVAATPAAAPAAEADLRAELAAMKAQMEALSRQLQAQQQAGGNPPAAAPLSPASAAAEARRAQASAAAARAAEQRAEREAQARAAQERKLAAEQQAREEAARRAEVAAQARRDAQARAEEARRLVEEQRAREEQARREAAEAKAREAQRLAEEKRAALEAARKAAAAPVATAAAVSTAEPATAPRANACGGVDGLYGITASNYRIEVKFAEDSLTVVEPNRTSVYKHLGQCQYAFTHPTGIEYRMGVVPRGLVAYKPGQSEAQKTPLALLQAAAAPQASGSCKAQEIPVENPQALHPGLTRLYGLHAIPGVTLSGRYQAPEPDGRPSTVLGERGEGGEFEVYGAPKPQYMYRILRWYIQANCDGTLVEEDFPVAKRYYLIYQLDRPYSGLAWQRTQFIVRKSEDRVSIDDRSKRKH